MIKIEDGYRTITMNRADASKLMGRMARKGYWCYARGKWRGLRDVFEYVTVTP